MTQNNRIMDERKLGKINIKESKISAMFHIMSAALMSDHRHLIFKVFFYFK